MTVSPGYLALVLHSHLPFVRHPGQERILEEDWLFEAISETYIPLMGVFERLEADGVPFRLTMSASPTLTEMLQDTLLQERYVRHLERLIELADREVHRTRHDPELAEVVRLYQSRFRSCHRDFTGKYARNLLVPLRHFQDEGFLEIITTAASHAFLPLLQPVPKAVRAQVEVAVRTHRRSFGKAPRGFWLPECGYYPGVEEELRPHNLEYFFTEAHGILYSEVRPRFGVYAPLYCENLVAAFGRDPESSRAVWSAEDGYPGHPVYREFYRDVGFELPLDYIGPYVHPGGVRVNTGFKYYAITGPGEDKRPYNRRAALRKVEEHAEHFLSSRLRQIQTLGTEMDRPPLVVCPYDAELFGHWWFEGPEWVESLLRRMGQDDRGLEMVSPSDYLRRHPDNQVSRPCFSSWGNQGYAEVWLDGSNDWIYRHLHKASEKMADLAARFPNEKGIRRRAINQAFREMLLAQASDWAFIMKTGTTVPYAVRRTKEHIHNFNRIYTALMNNQIEQEWLLGVEGRNNLFPDLDYRIFNVPA